MSWALTGVVHCLMVAHIAQGLGVYWNTDNAVVLAEGVRLLINGPARFEGMRVAGVGEYAWCHAPCGDTYVTVILDVTPVR
ncbi:MAG: hypothetical protein ACTTI9_05665 [Schaalia odontolytica]